MNPRRSPAARNANESGYALLLIMFLVMLLLLSTMVVAPSILTEGKREKEREMIWRGHQYVRGIKLYYRKLGRFPNSVEDLTKPKIGSIRFMRQAYKDPMNQQDGSWRFIYVGAAGQLIGSLKPPQANLKIPTSAFGGANPANASGVPGAPGAGAAQGVGGTPPVGAPPGVATPGANPLGITGTPVSADQGDPNAGSQAIPMGDTPVIIGGNIIGVGSKINRPSVIVYDKAKNYRLFEFIWDPSKETISLGQPGVQIGTPPGVGSTPSPNPANPPNPPPAPPQQQQQ